MATSYDIKEKFGVFRAAHEAIDENLRSIVSMGYSEAVAEFVKKEVEYELNRYVRVVNEILAIKKCSCILLKGVNTGGGSDHAD